MIYGGINLVSEPALVPRNANDLGIDIATAPFPKLLQQRKKYFFSESASLA